ncbi:MAG: hypothetical protein WBW16_14520 [Bacteroidota bacterium]
MSLDRNAARSWSKERIKEEIADRRTDISDRERNIEDMDEQYSRDRYRGAEPGWSNQLWANVRDIEEEIRFLESLL